MSEEEFKTRVEQRWGNKRFRHNRSRRWVGAFLLVIGGLLLARAGGVIFPAWFFTWPVLLIGIGVFSGIRHGFRGGGWIIPIIVGAVFLSDRLTPDARVRPYLWPAILIGVGLVIIFRPKKNCRRFDDGGDNNFNSLSPANDADRAKWEQAMRDGSDVIDATAIFGGVKKNVLNKNFKGGDITAFMGGAEINLQQADIEGKVILDCFNMFGGTKLIVPADWDVQSDVVTIFGGVEDKRQLTGPVNPAKVLYLDGTCIFGGLEIKSY